MDTERLTKLYNEGLRAERIKLSDAALCAKCKKKLKERFNKKFCSWFTDIFVEGPLSDSDLKIIKGMQVAKNSKIASCEDEIIFTLDEYMLVSGIDDCWEALRKIGEEINLINNLTPDGIVFRFFRDRENTYVKFEIPYIKNHARNTVILRIIEGRIDLSRWSSFE